MRSLLAWFGAIRPRESDHAHKATLARADRLIRVANDYAKAEEARRDR